MNELSLFTGAGGGLLGTKLLGWRAIGYVEKEEYCQRVIAQRIADGILDQAPIFGDIRIFNDEWAQSYYGLVDVITAGFPCQPFSVAGKQIGEDDERNMWPETIKSIRLVRPRFCLLENVPGLLTSGYFGTILGDLATSGYDCKWFALPAFQVGAPHKRKRTWIMSYPTGNGLQESIKKSEQSGLKEKHHGNRFSKMDCPKVWDDWESSPELFRDCHGVADRMDRIKAIGNGQVPAVVRAAWELLNE